LSLLAVSAATFQQQFFSAIVARGMLASEAAIEAQKYSSRRPHVREGGATPAELIDLGRHSQKSSSIVLGYVEPRRAQRPMRKLGL